MYFLLKDDDIHSLVLLVVGMDRSSFLDYIARSPIIDNHAHNLLELDVQLDPIDQLLTITSEASGKALKHARHTLVHQRAVRQLCEIEGIPPDQASWDAYLKKRKTLSEDEFTRRSFQGIHTILLDDGLRHSSKLHPYDWHSKYLKSPVKRIVRIETLAEDILVEVATHYGEDECHNSQAVSSFRERLVQAIHDAMEDEHVAGFKSVICYRTGLDIVTDNLTNCDVEIGDALKSAKKGSARINYKPLNDYFVRMLGDLLTAWGYKNGRLPKPVQSVCVMHDSLEKY